MRTIYDNVFSSTNPKEVLNFKLEENLMPKRNDGSFFDKDIPYTPVFENPVSLSIMNKLRMTSNNRMSSIHQYGVSSLCRNNKLLGAGDNDIAVITGKAGEPVEITKTTADCSSYRHIDSWKVITNQNGGIRTIGAMKILPPGIAATFNIVSFEAHSEVHATNMLNYLETNFVSFLISKVKRMQVNSQTVFNAIPLLDFNINWTDEMLYSYFNLSADEISLITG